MHTYKRQSTKGFRDGNRIFANKQTNTPNNFILCSLCEEKFSKGNVTDCLGDQERSIKEYSNALAYINSCHSIINYMMTQNSDFKDCFINMPSIPNFLNLFSALLAQGWENKKKEEEKEKNACEPNLIKSKKIGNADQRRQSTESETSDFELDGLQNARKVPLSKFQSKLPKNENTIYEEEVTETEKTSTKRCVKSPKPSQRKLSPASALKGKKYGVIVAPVQDANKKLKPRSCSAVTPRSRGGIYENKHAADWSGNYSDTALSTCGQNKEDLTQQDLDKYAKELLGSGSGTPIHSPRSSSPENRCQIPSTPEKSPTRMIRKGTKPSTQQSGSNIRKYSEIIRKSYSSQERQMLGAPIDNCVIKVSPSLKNNGIEQPSDISLPPSPSQHNQSQHQLQTKRTKSKPSQRNVVEDPRAKTPPNKSPTPSTYAVFATLQSSKDKAGSYTITNEDNPYAMQQFMQLTMKKHDGQGHQQADGQTYEKQDNYEGRKVLLRATPSKCGQYSAKMKQKGNFNSTSKLSAAEMKLIESQVQLFVEQHVESDDVKTESDIEEDISKKQSRIVEERRKMFRESRKRSESEDEEQVIKFNEDRPYSSTNEVYQRIQRTSSQMLNSPKRTHVSDESSDIKSDDDPYDPQRQRQVHGNKRTSYNHSHNGGPRH